MLLTLAVATIMQVAPADTTSQTWQLQGDVSGFPINSTCTVRVVDTVLTGSCTSPEGAYDIVGSVKGENVTFSHDSDYEGQAISVIYTGTAQSETEVRGTIDVQPFDVSGYFTARLVPNPPAAP